MALRDEIKPYIDGNDLVAPNKVAVGTLKGSDNGPMFTAEFIVMLKKLGQLINGDPQAFDYIINRCIDHNGLLNRVPTTQNDGQEAPDDYYGVLNGCKQIQNTEIPRGFLLCVLKYKGALNNVNPGLWTAQSFLIRQPQLLAAMLAAAFPSWFNPLHIAIRTLFAPLFWIAAVSIAISCMFTPKDQADPRRLSWHLLQTVQYSSLPCFLAARIWYWRLYRTYGKDGMKAVAAYYYQPGHPFIKYWIS